MNALTLCNNCDAADAVAGDPRGYCAECIFETDQPLFVNENGRAVCPEHIGHYARTFLRKRPNVTIFQTPTDHWVRADDWGLGCEDCLRKAGR